MHHKTLRAFTLLLRFGFTCRNQDPRCGTQLKKSAAILGLVLTLTSCSPLYVPTSRTLNYFASPGEVNATGLVDYSGFEGRAAASITNHLFIHGGGQKSFYGLLNARDTLKAGGMLGSFNHRLVEVGAGYYGKLFGKNVEVQAGYSQGKSDAFESIRSDPDGLSSRFYPSRTIVSAYNRFYVNAGIALLQQDQLKISFNLRGSLLKFSKIYSQSSQFVFDTDNRFFFMEPAIDIRRHFGRSSFYFLANTGFCRRADTGPGRGVSINAYNARPEVWGWNNTIGLGFHLGKKR